MIADETSDPRRLNTNDQEVRPASIILRCLKRRPTAKILTVHFLATTLLVTSSLPAQIRPPGSLRPVIQKYTAGVSNSPSQAKTMSSTGSPSGVIWGPTMKLTDDPIDSMFTGAGSYTPHLAAQGETLHCTFFGGNEVLPYIRSTDGGLTWEPQRELLASGSLPCQHDWDVILADSNRVAILFTMMQCSGSENHVYFIESTDRGTTWLVPVAATTDTTFMIPSGSMLGDTLVGLYSPDSNQHPKFPRITRSTDEGTTWIKNPFDMPSAGLNFMRVALTPGLLNFFHEGEFWPGPAPEIVLHRSTDLADSWQDSVVLSPVDTAGSDDPEVATFTHPGIGDPATRTTIGVMWRGEEFGGGYFSAGMALRLSYDNGATWAPMQVVSDTPRGTFHDLEILGNVVAAAWSFDYTDFGPHEVRARVSFDCGQSWDNVYNLTPGAENAGVPSIALTKSAVHVAWEQFIDGKWNIYYRRGELKQSPPPLSSSFVNYDTVAVGCTAWRAVTVRNDRCNPLDLHAFTSDDEEYTVDPPWALIDSGDSVTFIIRFDPLTSGDRGAVLLLDHNQSPVPDTVTLSGYAEGTGSETVISQTYSPGWALVSVPVSSPCPYLLPGSYLYRGSYVASETLVAGDGYWQKITHTDLSFAGSGLSELSVDVAYRWNLIGSISSPVAVSDIASTPPGVVVSSFYGYDGSEYYIADSIQPGRAYWVKVSQDATLSLSSTSAASAFTMVRIQDTGEMPPPPPAGSGESHSPQRLSGPPIPTEYSLEQNYPNPFNPMTEIFYQVPVSTHVSMEVYNAMGQKVATLVDETKAPGTYSVRWDGGGLSSGVYYCRLRAGVFQATKGMVVLK
jgi:hypothetical protein